MSVKNSIGNGVAKVLLCLIHGHELRRGVAGGNGVSGGTGQRRKNWDNSNSIINKMFLKKNQLMLIPTKDFEVGTLGPHPIQNTLQNPLLELASTREKDTYIEKNSKCVTWVFN